jgi:hypothetical protein
MKNFFGFWNLQILAPESSKYDFFDQRNVENGLWVKKCADHVEICGRDSKIFLTSESWILNPKIRFFWWTNSTKWISCKKFCWLRWNMWRGFRIWSGSRITDSESVLSEIIPQMSVIPHFDPHMILYQIFMILWFWRLQNPDSESFLSFLIH